jgi:hypothetical protein
VPLVWPVACARVAHGFHTAGRATTDQAGHALRAYSTEAIIPA